MILDRRITVSRVRKFGARECAQRNSLLWCYTNLSLKGVTSTMAFYATRQRAALLSARVLAVVRGSCESKIFNSIVAGIAVRMIDQAIRRTASKVQCPRNAMISQAATIEPDLLVTPLGNAACFLPGELSIPAPIFVNALLPSDNPRNWIIGKKRAQDFNVRQFLWRARTAEHATHWRPPIYNCRRRQMSRSRQLPTPSAPCWHRRSTHSRSSAMLHKAQDRPAPARYQHRPMR